MSELKDCRVLVVEDNYFLATTVGDALEMAGAEVIGLASGVAEAQRLIDACDRRVDAVVLDVNLCGDMSYPLAEHLAQADIPFVFTTGYDPHVVQQHYAGRPVCAKPFNAAELVGAVKAICTRN